MPTMKPNQNYKMHSPMDLSFSSRSIGNSRWLLPLLLSCALALVSSGCASMAPQPEKKAERHEDLTKLKKYYVTPDRPPEKQNARHERTLKAVSDALAGRGNSVSSGAATAMPTDTECKVVVKDHWFWDMSWYLLRLDVTFVDPRTGTTLAYGWVRRADPSLRREPEFVANEVLDDITQAMITGKAP